MKMAEADKRGTSLRQILWVVFGLLGWGLIPFLPITAEAKQTVSEDFTNTVHTLASFGDRSTGTSGNKAAAKFIKNRLSDLGLDTVGSHWFSVPVIRHGGSSLVIPDKDLSRADSSDTGQCDHAGDHFFRRAGRSPDLCRHG